MDCPIVAGYRKFMNALISKVATRVKNVFMPFAAFGVFLLMTTVPWLLALTAYLLSIWLYYGKGWRIPGAVVMIAAVALAATLLSLTCFCLVGFLVVAIRAVLGLESYDDAHANRLIWLLSAAAYVVGGFFWLWRYDVRDSFWLVTYCCAPIPPLIAVTWSAVRERHQRSRADHGQNEDDRAVDHR